MSQMMVKCCSRPPNKEIGGSIAIFVVLHEGIIFTPTSEFKIDCFVNSDFASLRARVMIPKTRMTPFAPNTALAISSPCWLCPFMGF